MLTPEHQGVISFFCALIATSSVMRRASNADTRLPSGVSAYSRLPLPSFIGKRVALLAGGRWSLWSALYTNIDVEVEVEEGVVVGVRSAEWVTRGPWLDNTFLTSVEFRLGKYTNMRASVSYRLLGDNFPLQVLPALELYWRFGL